MSSVVLVSKTTDGKRLRPHVKLCASSKTVPRWFLHTHGDHSLHFGINLIAGRTTSCDCVLARALSSDDRNPPCGKS